MERNHWNNRRDYSPKRRSFYGKYKFLEKWLKFSKYNRFLEEVDIIPFKVPLSRDFDHQLSRHQRFDFYQVYDFSIDMKKPITDVIDLTDTYRYYDSQRDNFYPPDVKHHKFRLPGKRVPNKQDLDGILNVMEDLINQKRVIGIHCTHGINRTGYIVCMFLIEKLGWEPAEAIIAFQKARGEEISHSEYIEAVLELEDLTEFYNISYALVEPVKEIIQQKSIQDEEQQTDVATSDGQL